MQTRISCAYSHETAFCSLTRNNMLEATIWPQMIKMSCVVCLRCSQRLWTDILKTTVDVDKLKYDNCKDYILKHLFFFPMNRTDMEMRIFGPKRWKLLILFCCNNCRKQNYRLRIVFRTHSSLRWPQCFLETFVIRIFWVGDSFHHV